MIGGGKGRGGIRRQLYIVQIVSLLVFLIIGWTSVRQAQQDAADRTNLYAEISFNQTVQSLDVMFDSLATTTQSFAYTQLVQRLLQNAEGMRDAREVYNSVMSNIRFIINTNENVIDIALVGVDGRHYLFGEQIGHALANFAAQYEAARSGDAKRGVFTGFLGEDVYRYKDCFLYILPVYSSLQGEQYGKRVGLCMTLCRAGTIKRAMAASLSDNNRLALLGDRGEPLAVMGVERDARRMLAGNAHTFPVPGWTLSQQVYMDGAAEGLIYSNAGIILILTASMIMLAMMLLVHRNISAPIEQINRQLLEITAAPEEGRELAVGPKNELSTIAEGINLMLKNLQIVNQRNLESERNLLQAEILKNKLQLSALQSQINPHFLYNTLACIRGMAMENQMPIIARIASNMAAMFRYSIRGDTFVRLRDEVAIVERYLAIMNLRMDDRFRFTIEIPEGLRDVWIVKMTLQPLVENAVFHGIERVEREGRIRIEAASLDEGRYVLRIRDNGVGIPEANLAYLNARLRAGEGMDEVHETSRGMGIGMMNINRKIRLLAGETYGLVVQSIENVETTVEITMPVLTVPPEA